MARTRKTRSGARRTNAGTDIEFGERKAALARNVTRALRVAHTDFDGSAATIAAMTRTELAGRSGVARATIQKLLGAAGSQAPECNPDLKTLCAIANALGTSPAMLLMGPRDWNAVLGVASRLEMIRKGGVSTLADGNPSAEALAEYAIVLAQRFGLVPEMAPVDQGMPSRIDEEISERIRKRVAGIAVGAAMSTSVERGRVSAEEYCALAVAGSGLSSSVNQ